MMSLQNGVLCVLSRHGTARRPSLSPERPSLANDLFFVKGWQWSVDCIVWTVSATNGVSRFFVPSRSVRSRVCIGVYAAPCASLGVGATFMKWSLLALALSAFAFPALADDEAPDKSDFTLFNPTPDADLRSFNTDRPPKANSPYTVDAGHFQYETDIAVYSYGNSDGVKTQDWTVVDPTLKLGLTNTIDAELQITPYESVVTN